MEYLLYLFIQMKILSPAFISFAGRNPTQKETQA